MYFTSSTPFILYSSEERVVWREREKGMIKGGRQREAGRETNKQHVFIRRSQGRNPHRILPIHPDQYDAND